MAIDLLPNTIRQTSGNLNVFQMGGTTGAGTNLTWKLSTTGNLVLNYQASPTIIPGLLVAAGEDAYNDVVNCQTNYFKSFGNAETIVPIRPQGLAPCYLSFVIDSAGYNNTNVAVGRMYMVNVVYVIETVNFGTPPSYLGDIMYRVTNSAGTITRGWEVRPNQLRINALELGSIGSEPFQVRHTDGTGVPAMALSFDGTLDGTYRVIQFFGYVESSAIGSIIINNTSGAISFPSDYRIKRNISEITDGVDTLGRLRPVWFNWRKQPNDEPYAGFIAHEFAEVLPEAVSGEKDEVDQWGDIKAQGLDQRRLIPFMASALKQLASELTELEARVDAWAG